MASFKEMRSILLQSFDDGCISEDKFLLLYDVNTSKNPDFPYESYRKFGLNDMDDSECLYEFRFRKSDLHVLSEALNLPNYLMCQEGTICDGVEGLCIALRRFAYSCRLSDSIRRFGCPVPELSMISSLVVDTVYQEHNHRIPQWNDTLLNPALLEMYARAIQQNGSPLHNCFGFIDGTVRPICRPDQKQRIVYNGHKRVWSKIPTCGTTQRYDSQHVWPSK